MAAQTTGMLGGQSGWRPPVTPALNIGTHPNFYFSPDMGLLYNWDTLNKAANIGSELSRYGDFQNGSQSDFAQQRLGMPPMADVTKSNIQSQVDEFYRLLGTPEAQADRRAYFNMMGGNNYGGVIRNLPEIPQVPTHFIGEGLEGPGMGGYHSDPHQFDSGYPGQTNNTTPWVISGNALEYAFPGLRPTSAAGGIRPTTLGDLQHPTYMWPENAAWDYYGNTPGQYGMDKKYGNMDPTYLNAWANSAGFPDFGRMSYHYSFLPESSMPSPPWQGPLRTLPEQATFQFGPDKVEGLNYDPWGSLNKSTSSWGTSNSNPWGS